MPIGPNGEKRPANKFEYAFLLPKIATGEVQAEYVDSRYKGGPAWARTLTPERRSEIARKAAQTRWHKNRKVPT